MPLFHVGGSSYVLLGIHDGVPSVMTRDPGGASLAGAIMQGANCTFLVPAVLAQVLQSGDETIKLFGQFNTYCYGASPMPLPFLRAALEAWPDTEATEDELISWCREQLASFECPKSVDIRDALPRNPTGRSSSATCAGRTGRVVTGPPSSGRLCAW